VRSVVRSFAFILPALLFPLGGVVAATKTATFVVQAQVVADCAIVAADLNFGSVGVLTANNDAQTSVTCTCSSTTPYSLGLNAGTATGSTVTNRLLANGASTLQYQLYRDSARTQVWGNTIGTDVTTGTGTGNGQTYVVYGRVPVQSATPAPGTYTSTLTVTVTF
jgi:spore coat protein U-like protein